MPSRSRRLPPRSSRQPAAQRATPATGDASTLGASPTPTCPWDSASASPTERMCESRAAFTTEATGPRLPQGYSPLAACRPATVWFRAGAHRPCLQGLWAGEACGSCIADHQILGTPRTHEPGYIASELRGCPRNSAQRPYRAAILRLTHPLPQGVEARGLCLLVATGPILQVSRQLRMSSPLGSRTSAAPQQAQLSR